MYNAGLAKADYIEKGNTNFSCAAVGDYFIVAAPL
jgi:hypothetical protein